jgi:excisionase family DNA binding protein
MKLAATEYSLVRTKSLIDLLVSLDAVLTVTDAARLLGIQRGSVCKMIERGTLYSLTIGSHLYVLRSEVIQRLKP